MAKPKTFSVTMRLIKNGLTDATMILRLSPDIETFPLKGFGLKGHLYVRKSRTHDPKWLGLIQPAVGTVLEGVFNASSAALMLIEVDKRLLAITFGQSWHWIDDGAIERRFGLIAALNSIGNNDLKVVDAQQIDSLSVSRRTQSSRSSDINVFGLDVHRDLMRAVTGKPSAPDVGKLIMGADALRITTKLTIDKLADKCRQLLKIYQLKSYQENYGWIDNIAYVKDRMVISELNKLLLTRINAEDTENLYLSSPRIPDIMQDDGYLYEFDDDDEDPRPDISIEDWLAGVEDELPIDIDYLKENKIRIFSGGSDHPIESPSVYQYIIFEIKHAWHLYCLANGELFAIEDNYVRQIDKQVAAIDKSALPFIDYKISEDEDKYNDRLAKSLSAASLDKKTVSYGGGRSKVEICDVLTSKPEFIHVKKSCSSSLLSHLFQQGVVSGTLVLETGFRKLCATKAPDKFKKIFDDSIFDANKTEIVFAIITKKSDTIPSSLPFFSKQTLLNAASLLAKYRYKVTVAGVKDAT